MNSLLFYEFDTYSSILFKRHSFMKFVSAYIFRMSKFKGKSTGRGTWREEDMKQTL